MLKVLALISKSPSSARFTSAVIGLLCLSIVDRLSVNNATLEPCHNEPCSWLVAISTSGFRFSSDSRVPNGWGPDPTSHHLVEDRRSGPRHTKCLASGSANSGLIHHGRGRWLFSGRRPRRPMDGFHRLVPAPVGTGDLRRDDLAAVIGKIKVGDLMIQEFPTVDGHESLQKFVDETLLPTGGRSFLVTEDGSAVGFITPREIKRIARTQWPIVKIETIMRPFKNIQPLPPTRRYCTPLKSWPKTTSARSLSSHGVGCREHYPGKSCSIMSKQ